MNGSSIDTIRLRRRWRALDTNEVLGSRPGLRLVELPSSRVRVRVAGAGKETLVFVCDPPNVIEQYDEVVTYLAPSYRVVVMEQPGFGFSFPKPGFRFTPAAYAEAQLGVLRALAMEPYVLVAPCFSAFYALICANEGVDQVTKLVLMQATSWPEQNAWMDEVAKTFTASLFGMPFGDKLAALPFLAQVTNAFVERRFPELTHPYAVHKALQRPELLARFVESGRRAFALGACNCMQSLYQRYFAEGDERELPTPPQPTLILWGNQDYWHDNRNVEEQFPGWRGRLVRRVMNEVKSDKRGLLRYVPHANYAEIDDTGHHLELENPRAVCARVREFVGS